MIKAVVGRRIVDRTFSKANTHGVARSCEGGKLGDKRTPTAYFLRGAYPRIA
jgi:hypothetical protein